MGLLSLSRSKVINRNDVQVGDHLFTWRAGNIYSHHGIYVGRGEIVHFTHDWLLSSLISSSSSATNPTCSNTRNCGFRKFKSGVIISCLKCFLADGSLYRFEYGVGLFSFFANVRGGTCTRAESDPPEDVVQRAMYYLLHYGYGEYDLLKNNCEDFALHCKTGLLVVRSEKGVGGSGQASTLASVAPAAAVAAVGFVAPVALLVSVPVVTFALIFSYSCKRYADDIGVRADVVKVEAKDVDYEDARSNGFEDVDKERFAKVVKYLSFF